MACDQSTLVTVYDKGPKPDEHRVPQSEKEWHSNTRTKLTQPLFAFLERPESSSSIKLKQSNLVQDKLAARHLT